TNCWKWAVETKKYSRPSSSLGRGARVVCEVEARRFGRRPSRALTRLVLPAPEGAEMTKRRSLMRGIFAWPGGELPPGMSLTGYTSSIPSLVQEPFHACPAASPRVCVRRRRPHGACRLPEPVGHRFRGRGAGAAA